MRLEYGHKKNNICNGPYTYILCLCENTLIIMKNKKTYISVISYEALESLSSYDEKINEKL